MVCSTYSSKKFRSMLLVDKTIKCEQNANVAIEFDLFYFVRGGTLIQVHNLSI